MDIKDYINKIVNKKFSTRTKGYDPDEVDLLFDDLIEKLEYQYNQKILVEDEMIKLKSEKEILNNQIKKLEMSNEELKSHLDQINKSGYQNHNIMQRINSVENALSDIMQLNNKKKKNN